MDISGGNPLKRISTSIRPPLPDDMAVGFIFSKSIKTMIYIATKTIEN